MNTEKLVKEQHKLEELCKDNVNLNEIKRLVKNGIKPTSKCLENACLNKSNKQIINFLVNNHCEISEQVVKNILSTYGNNLINIIYTKYNDKKKQDSIKQNKINGKILYRDTDSINLSSDIINKEKIEKKDDNDYNNKYKMININTNNKYNDDDIININNKLIKMLKIKKNTKLNFNNFKKCFLNYINQNNLYDKENKIMIKINNELSNCTNYKENEYFNFLEFNNFLYSLVN